ncbi:hypothetical protein [Paraflavitalea pollutisoli]|uniref:hypothetical protein n=1 Tax=Paraflavitalea pollutisoli TaxID=3034143 RepID=UPI0023EB8A62|nr:hypothetical protein [Paraflavitalea sp. H1-2-19X]
MKKSMQVIAMAAFLGCFALLAIAAGSEKAKAQEGCGEEWHKTEAPGDTENNTERVMNEVASRWADGADELVFHARFFHRII